MLTLTINTLILDPAPAVSIRRSILSHSDGGGVRETWLLNGVLRAESPADLAGLRDSLEAALATPSLLLKSGDTTLRALDPLDCRVPPRCAELKIDASDQSQIHTNADWSARVEATLREGTDPVLALELRITREESAGGPLRIISEGTATLAPGTGDGEAADLLLPVPASGFRRVESRVVLRPDSTSSFRAVDAAELVALPSGVSDGHYAVTQSRDRDGRLTRITEGFYAGPSSAARARELRPPSHLILREEVRDEPFTGRTVFRYESLLGVGEAALRTFGESVSFREVRRVVVHPLLSPGAEPHRQETGPPMLIVTQEGVAQGGRTHPQPPLPLFPQHVAEREVSYSPPTSTGSTSSPRETRWRYVMHPPHTTPLTP